MAGWKRFKNIDSRYSLLLVGVSALLLTVIGALVLGQMVLQAKTAGAGYRFWIIVLLTVFNLCTVAVLFYFLFNNNLINEDEYQSFISRAPMAVAMLDTEMNYMAVSNQWYQQYGLDEDLNLIGKNHYEVFPEIRGKPDWLDIHQKSLEGEDFFKEEDFFKRQDGTKQYIRWAVRPWYLGDDVGGLLMYTEDITDVVKARKDAASRKKELEEKVRRRTEKLEWANKDLEAFSYSVSHDLRTPLRAITGFSQILSEEYASELDDEGQRLLDVIIDNTGKMATLIDDILSFSRVTRADLVKTKVDIKQLFEDATETVIDEYQEIEEKIDVEIKDLPKAKGDMSLLKQVAVNLVSNAVKYSSKNEEIKVEVGYRNNQDPVTYYVKDNGVGFDMKYSDKLFGVFERLHSSAEFEGTGVGLSLVNRIIKQHNGNIWAESEPGEGTTFLFHF